MPPVASRVPDEFHASAVTMSAGAMWVAVTWPCKSSTCAPFWTLTASTFFAPGSQATDCTPMRVLGGCNRRINSPFFASYSLALLRPVVSRVPPSGLKAKLCT